MNAFIRYNSIIAAFILLPLFYLNYLAFSSQPLSGDLTRVGGHLEEDFGWNAPQVAFKKGRFVMAKSISDLDRHFDVLVVGDSFSADQQKGWQNYLVENTGLSVITFYMAHGFNLADIVASKQYKNFPPKILIYESVERLAFVRLHEFADWSLEEQRGQENLPLHHNKVTAQEFPKKKQLRKVKVDLERLFAEAANYIEKSLYRFTKKHENKTVVLPLRQDNLFSSGEPDKLLVLKNTLHKELSEDDVTKAVQGLQKARYLVEMNGKTRFVYMMFPDKVTAYSPFLSPDIKPVPSAFPPLAERYPMLRLDQYFQSALRQGAKDLYLPNDTHTGSTGFKAAAFGLIDYILK